MDTTLATQVDHLDDVRAIVARLHVAVQDRLDAGTVPARATMSELEFATWWQHLDAVGVRRKSSRDELAIDVHYPSGKVTVRPSVWCSVGSVGVA